MSQSMRTWAAGVCVATLVASASGQISIAPGIDPWVSVNPTQVNFGTDVPVIPAGFFDPGSEPFTGLVVLGGQSIDPALSPADTVVQRLGAGTAFFPGPPATVPIQIVALELRSVNPITVNSLGGPSQWDVRVTIDTVSPSTGNMTINVNPTLNGGTFTSTMNIRPLFIFTNVVSGSTLNMLGPVLPLNSTIGQWTTTPPAGVQYPGAGTNFYPTPTPVGWQSPALGFMQQRVRTQGADCNGNGVIDSQDLLSGTSYDANNNRIPDECEATSGLEQLSWLNAAGGFAQRFSRFGRLTMTVVEPGDGQIVWLNAVVNGIWVVQNCPIHALQGPGEIVEHGVDFDLRNLPGVQVPSVMLLTKLTTSPLNAPPAGTPSAKPVLEAPGSLGMDYDPGTLPLPFDTWFPNTPADFVNPALPANWITVERHGVGGIDEARNFCAPGAAARSLDWMNHLYCLMLPAALNDPTKLYDKLKDMDHMMTSGATGSDIDKQISGIQKCINDNMLGDKLEVKQVMNPTGSDIIDSLAAGNDVLGRACLTDGVNTWYHRFCIVGGTRCGDEITIDIRDDKQGDGKADTGAHSGKVTGAAGAVKVSAWGADATIVSMIVICPKRAKTLSALNKYLFGDGVGGMTEGIKPLLDRIAGGHTPTAAELDMLKKWACNALDLIRYLRKQLDKCGTQAAKDAADRLIIKLALLKSDIITYCVTGSPAYLALAQSRLSDPATAADLATIKGVVDCNNNGIDDSVDILLNPALDLNGDCIMDACQTGLCCYGATCRVNVLATNCTENALDPAHVERAGAAFIAGGMFCNLVGPPGDMGPKNFKMPCCKSDYNKSGVKTVQDLFDFLADYFAKKSGADTNGAPPAAGAPVTVQDLFDYLAAYFAGGCVAP